MYGSYRVYRHYGCVVVFLKINLHRDNLIYRQKTFQDSNFGKFFFVFLRRKILNLMTLGKALHELGSESSNNGYGTWFFILFFSSLFSKYRSTGFSNNAIIPSEIADIKDTTQLQPSNNIRKTATIVIAIAYAKTRFQVQVSKKFFNQSIIIHLKSTNPASQFESYLPFHISGYKH